MEDAAIVDLYWQRSDRAIPETDRKYGPYCHSIAYQICTNREDAEECVNDTWFRAWNLMPDKRPAALSPFLGAIVRNLALDRWRRSRRQKRGGGETELALEELADCVPARDRVEQRLEEAELAAAINAFLARLPEADRKLFVARYWFLTPISRLAEKLECRPGSVRTRLYRLRLRLQEELRREGLV